MAQKIYTKRFTISCFEDIERMLKDNNIIPGYEKLLLQINKSSVKLQSLEDNRSYEEIFSDWAAGERPKINTGRLFTNLDNLKQELLNGIKIYTKLISQKEKLEDFFQISELNVTKVGQFGAHGKKGRKRMTEENSIKVQKVYERLNGVAQSLMLCIGAQTQPIATAIVGAGAVANICLIIYDFAQVEGKKRALKYQEVVRLDEELEKKEVLAKIKTDHEVLTAIFDSIEEIVRE